MDIPPNLTQKAVINLLFIFYEYSHLLDDGDITLLETLYYIGPYNKSIKADKIQVLTQTYGNDPFNTIIQQLMAIFDTDVVFTQGMGENNYIIAMNSLKILYDNIINLPVNLPEYSLPPKTPNKWVQKEDELMDNMADAFEVAQIIKDAKSAADLSLQDLQDYRRILTDGIVKFKPLFEHAKENPGMIDFYKELKKDLENALKKIQELSEEQPRQSPVKRSRSPIQTQPRRSKRLQTKQKKGGLRKIKTVRKFNKRNKPNNHNKPKSRRG